MESLFTILLRKRAQESVKINTTFTSKDPTITKKTVPFKRLISNSEKGLLIKV
jgi:hypothetical protein